MNKSVVLHKEVIEYFHNNFYITITMGLFTKTSVAAPVPGGGVPGRVLESDQSPDSLFALPHAGQNSDPGGGETTVLQVPPV